MKDDEEGEYVHCITQNLNKAKQVLKNKPEWLNRYRSKGVIVSVNTDEIIYDGLLNEHIVYQDPGYS